MLRTFRGILPTVDPTAYVDASAQVIGDVHIGPESSVWMNVVIRGDVHWIRIGARTNVQDGTVVHVQAAPIPPPSATRSRSATGRSSTAAPSRTAA